MRIGFIGPVDRYDSQLEQIVAFFLDTVRVRQVVYVGADSKLNSYVASCRARLNGGDAALTAWSRSLDCIHQTAEQIDAHLAAEPALARFDNLSSLQPGEIRQVRLAGGQPTIFCYDRMLVEDDVLQAASIIVFGKEQGPIVKQVGKQLWLSPGSLAKAGVMIVDENSAGLRLAVFNRECKQVAQHHWTAPTTGPQQ